MGAERAGFRRRPEPGALRSRTPATGGHGIEEDPSDWADGKVDEAREIYERQGTVLRWTWIVVGFVIVAAGLAMTVFPGPVTVVVPLGLIMLAAVFGWARTLLLRSVEYGEEATRRFRRASRPVRWLTVGASACLAAAVVAWMVL